MWLLFAIQLGTAFLFLLLGWAIKRGAFWLISGFSTRPEEEQKLLIENEYPQKMGNLLISTAAGIILLLPLMFSSFQYAIEMIFGFMLVYLLGGIMYLSRYEVPKKRKKSYIISISIAAVTFIPIGILLFLGYQDAQLVLKEESFEVTGMYGSTWKYSDIEEIKLLDKMPEVTWRVNGFGLETVSKGKFKVTGYGTSLLFIQKGVPPYLHIKTKDEDIFINAENSSKTRTWEKQLLNQMEINCRSSDC
ncbi:hypothetical protein A8F94_18015 [Bacillus sp. FJAT-27225]|uniref:DUF3784 domain-containing protein n=1 Tax=Bacillus sp. FJAT-27225 TaxID=1743144 RepID=UPI00080C20A9|nr:DUF3784 domain-containing protein [Bacillus sp. FJAT-27225]OCA83041.1 hypothetical protein A8F94_18015 [Bacillus sp. FJAT-27225]